LLHDVIIIDAKRTQIGKSICQL